MNSKIKKIALMFALILTIGFSIVAVGCGRKNGFAGDAPENSYQINYVLGAVGVKNNALNPSLYVEGETTNLYPASFTSSDTFEGWFLDASFTNKVDKLNDSVLTSVQGTSINLYAKFKVLDISGTTLNNVTPWGKVQEKIIIPSEITTISDAALNGLSVKEIDLSSCQINVLPAECFKDCGELIKCVLPNSNFIFVGDGFQSTITNPFVGCLNLVEISVNNNTSSYLFDNLKSHPSENTYALYKKMSNTSDQYMLVCGTTKTKFVAVNNNTAVVIGIAKNAFKGLPITEINLGAVNYISNSAFARCVSLLQVSAAGSNIWVLDSAFKNCTKLSSAQTLFDRVEKIYQEAFFNCGSLPNFTLGENLNYIGVKAFYQVDTYTGSGNANRGIEVKFANKADWTLTAGSTTLTYSPSWVIIAGTTFSEKNTKALALDKQDLNGYSGYEWVLKK